MVKAHVQRKRARMVDSLSLQKGYYSDEAFHLRTTQTRPEFNLVPFTIECVLSFLPFFLEFSATQRCTRTCAFTQKTSLNSTQTIADRIAPLYTAAVYKK